MIAMDAQASPEIYRVMPELLTPDEAAERLRVKPTTLAQWRGNPERRQPLPFVRVGGAVRYRAEDLVAFVERGVCVATSANDQQPSEQASQCHAD